MKITVINGTEKKGVTYRLKEIFLESFRNSAKITEFYLPKDGPGYCTGCTSCFLTKQELCKDYATVQKIEKAMLEAGLGKGNPEYTDFKYWKEQGWIDGVRPWK